MLCSQSDAQGLGLLLFASGCMASMLLLGHDYQNLVFSMSDQSLFCFALAGVHL